MMKTWISMALIATMTGITFAERPIEADLSKIAIEAGAERLVETTRRPPVTRPVGQTGKPETVPTKARGRFDRSKVAIETGAESLVRSARASAKESPTSHSSLAPTVISVKPGLVSWYKDYTTAQAASRVSGKPILLFQLLGKLDEYFT